MTKEEADKIFKCWQEYMEIAGKLKKLFAVVPESFLPYPADTIIEALTIIEKDFLDSGNEEASKTIQGTMILWLSPYITEFGFYNTKINDEEAIRLMKRQLDQIEKNPEWIKEIAKSLKETQDSWIKSRG